MERPPNCLWCESNRPALASSREMTIILRALDSTEYRKDRCDVGVATNNGLADWVALIFHGKTRIDRGCQVYSYLWRHVLPCGQHRKYHGWWWGIEVPKTEPLPVDEKEIQGFTWWSFQSVRVRQWNFPRLKDMFNLSDESLIISRSSERTTAAACLVERWGYCLIQSGVICIKEERVFQNIRQIIYVEVEQDWVPQDRLGALSLYWDRRWEGATDSNALTAWA